MRKNAIRTASSEALKPPAKSQMYIRRQRAPYTGGVDAAANELEASISFPLEAGITGSCHWSAPVGH